MRPSESFVDQPVRSLQTMLRVLAEDDPSLPTVVPDGIYGLTTMNAVTAFQRRQGLPLTGIVDQITWEEIVGAYEIALIRVGKAQPIEILLDPGQILKSGERGPYIHLAQAMLTQLSQDHASIPEPGNSGMIDEQTISAISAFQLLAGLPVTGEIDRNTWKHLVLQFTLNAHHNNAKKQNTNNNDYRI